MKTDLLIEGNGTKIRAYMLEKFKLWGGWKYSKATRVKKTLAYYVVANEEGKTAIRSAYHDVFREGWPSESLKKYELMLKSKEKAPKLERSQAIDLKEQKLAKLEHAVKTLELWKKNGEVQDGKDFMPKLKSLVNPLIDGTFDRAMFTQENFVRGVKSLTSSSNIDDKNIHANFEYMAGLHAKTKTEFIFDSSLLKGATSLETEILAGTWGSGSIQAKLGKDNFAMSAAIALAFGMDCSVVGDSVWKVGDFGVALEGKANLFVGAEAEGAASLKINRKGVEAKIKAGVFAGVRAKCSGKLALQYMDEDLVGIEAEAWFSFGAGATFEASIKSSLFGATEFKFAADLSVGLGSGASVATSVNFDKIALAAKSQLRNMYYLGPMMQGYDGYMIDDDRLNAHYLAKATKRLEDEIESLKERLSSVSKIPVEKQSLLMSMDDDW